MFITNDIKYVGVNDHQIDLFEGQYAVKNGMSYNSYVILDDKIAVMDTVDSHFGQKWLDNIQNVIKNRQPDYLVVSHMEPDHSANIVNFLNVYPNVTVVASDKAFSMMRCFFNKEFNNNILIIKENDILNLGKHTLTFIAAPMVHWPEVMMSYDSLDKVLFSADGFGKFGALDVLEPYDDEARRYYIGIVGKYGVQVQNVLKKACKLAISLICPLHGPVLKDNLAHYFNLYNTWSNYEVESTGTVIVYTSVYGHTKKAVEVLIEKLKANGCPKVVAYDLARSDMSFVIAEAFKYQKLVLATITYNAGIFPPMREFIEGLTERNFQNREVGFIENGSWAPLAYKVMKELLSGCKNLTFIEDVVHIKSALSDQNLQELESLSLKLCQ